MASSVSKPGVDVERDEPRDMQSNRVGPRWRAQRENAFRFSGMARFLDDQVPRRETKPGEHDDMARAGKSVEARPVLRLDLDASPAIPEARAAAMFFGQSALVFQGEWMRPMKTRCASAAIAAGSSAERYLALARLKHAHIPTRNVRAIFLSACDIRGCQTCEIDINISLYLNCRDRNMTVTA